MIFNKTSKYRVHGYTEEFKYVGKKSDGWVILETVNLGEVIQAHESLIEEIIPYTIEVQFQPNGQSYSFLADEGDFEVGDYVFRNKTLEWANNWPLCKVVETNSKSRAGKCRLVGLKLQGEWMN